MNAQLIRALSPYLRGLGRMTYGNIVRAEYNSPGCNPGASSTVAVIVPIHTSTLTENVTINGCGHRPHPSMMGDRSDEIHCWRVLRKTGPKSVVHISNPLKSLFVKLSVSVLHPKKKRTVLGSHFSLVRSNDFSGLRELCQEVWNQGVPPKVGQVWTLEHEDLGMRIS